MASASPIRYTPDVEQVPDSEGEAIASIAASMRSIVDTTYKDGGHGLRSVHAKSHALVEGTLTVLDDLPPELAQGLFAVPATYPVVMRISTNPGDILDDSVSTPRGLALKVIGVDGERLSGSEGERTQDFVLVNGPAFVASTPKQFATSLKLLAATTDRGEGLKKALSFVLRGAETALEAVGVQSPTLVSLGGQPETHPLGETFYSQVPIRFGDYIAKVAVAPVSPELTALTKAPLDVTGKPNGLRAGLAEFFADTSGTWELRVQLCTDLATMPVEDAAVVWPEDASPYRAVARIMVPAQPSWSEARAAVVDDGYSFTPWHGLRAHQPLGGVMRSRQPVYREIAAKRAGLNGCPLHEPTGLPGLPR